MNSFILTYLLTVCGVGSVFMAMLYQVMIGPQIRASHGVEDKDSDYDVWTFLRAALIIFVVSFGSCVALVYYSKVGF